MKEKIINIPIYWWKLHIIKWDFEKVSKKYNLDIIDIDRYDALTFSKILNWYFNLYFYFSETIRPDIIAHECLHWVWLLYEHIWANFVLWANDEHQAYILGWFVSICHKHTILK